MARPVDPRRRSRRTLRIRRCGPLATSVNVTGLVVATDRANAVAETKTTTEPPPVSRRESVALSPDATLRSPTDKVLHGLKTGILRPDQRDKIEIVHVDIRQVPLCF
jgi:hypothetical protein